VNARLLEIIFESSHVGLYAIIANSTISFRMGRSRHRDTLAAVESIHTLFPKRTRLSAA